LTCWLFDTLNWFLLCEECQISVKDGEYFDIAYLKNQP